MANYIAINSSELDEKRIKIILPEFVNLIQFVVLIVVADKY